jgi:hypothetical protein
VMHYFAIINFIMIFRDDPGETNYPYLRMGCHKDPLATVCKRLIPLLSSIVNKWRKMVKS